MSKQIEALKMKLGDIIDGMRTKAINNSLIKTSTLDRFADELNQFEIELHKALAEAEKQEPVAWMEEYQSCKVNEDERLCHSDKVFRLVQLLASQLGECQSLCAKYAEETVKNGEQKLKEVTAIKEALAEAEKQEPVGKMCLGCGTSMSDEKLEEKKRHNKYLVSCCPDRQMVDVYTHPDTWQSLSDDEMDDLFKKHGVMFLEGNFKFARAIEQALKEKNHEN